MKYSKEFRIAMRKLNIDKLRKHQISPINDIMGWRDCLVIFPTGSGKSAVFQIPALASKNLTVVIEPTLALIYDQVAKLQDCEVEADYICSSNKLEHNRIYHEIKSGELKLLYTTPESLHGKLRDILLDSRIDYFVVDECHCICEWGNSSFRPLYQELGNFIDSLEQRPVVIALTATAPKKYRDIIVDSLHMLDAKVYTSSLARSNIIVVKEDVSDKGIKKRIKKVKTYLKRYMGEGHAVIYCSTKSNVDAVYNYLEGREEFAGNVARCYSNMREKEREKEQLAFISGKKRIMVSTSAFGMGIDVPDIRLVLHLNLPFSIVDYYQQIGRAGRDGDMSHAVLLYSESDIKLNEYILNHTENVEDSKRAKKRLRELVEIFCSEDCIMQQVLKYLGEKDAKKCRYCSHCQRMKRGIVA